MNYEFVVKFLKVHAGSNDINYESAWPDLTVH